MKSIPLTWPPAAAIFDMDGLMLDTERIYHRTFRVVGQELGYTLSDDLLLATSGRTFPDVYRLIQVSLGADFPLATFQVRWPVLWHKDVAHQGIPCKPGLVELLDWLDGQGIPKAVATSSNASEADFTLRAGGIAARFTTVVTGDEIVHGKPAPDIYLLAAARLGVNPCIALPLKIPNPVCWPPPRRAWLRLWFQIPNSLRRKWRRALPRCFLHCTRRINILSTRR